MLDYDLVAKEGYMEDILLRRSGAAKLIMSEKGYSYKYALQLVHKGALTQKLLPAQLKLESKGLKENVYSRKEVMRYIQTLPGVSRHDTNN